MTITLEAVKAEQTKLSGMIASLEAAMKETSFFEFQGKRIPLELGEQYVGTIISANGDKREHIILLPGEVEKKSWKDAMAWAASIGGELPDRVESALLFATMKDEFKPEWYWTREQHASDSGCAWFQSFTIGSQVNNTKTNEFRARAVRRLPI